MFYILIVINSVCSRKRIAGWKFLKTGTLFSKRTLLHIVLGKNGTGLLGELALELVWVLLCQYSFAIFSRKQLNFEILLPPLPRLTNFFAILWMIVWEIQQFFFFFTAIYWYILWYFLYKEWWNLWLFLATNWQKSPVPFLCINW